MMETTEGPGLPLLARLFTSGRYRRATVDTTHYGEPLTSLSAAQEWRQKALLRAAMIEDLTRQRDELQREVNALREGRKTL